VRPCPGRDRSLRGPQVAVHARPPRHSPSSSVAAKSSACRRDEAPCAAPLVTGFAGSACPTRSGTANGAHGGRPGASEVAAAFHRTDGAPIRSPCRSDASRIQHERLDGSGYPEG
jgi:hypothetical protein